MERKQKKLIYFSTANNHFDMNEMGKLATKYQHIKQVILPLSFCSFFFSFSFFLLFFLFLLFFSFISSAPLTNFFSDSLLPSFPPPLPLSPLFSQTFPNESGVLNHEGLKKYFLKKGMGQRLANGYSSIFFSPFFFSSFLFFPFPPSPSLFHQLFSFFPSPPLSLFSVFFRKQYRRDCF